MQHSRCLSYSKTSKILFYVVNAIFILSFCKFDLIFKNLSNLTSFVLAKNLFSNEVVSFKEAEEVAPTKEQTVLNDIINSNKHNELLIRLLSFFSSVTGKILKNCQIPDIFVLFASSLLAYYSKSTSNDFLKFESDNKSNLKEKLQVKYSKQEKHKLEDKLFNQSEKSDKKQRSENIKKLIKRMIEIVQSKNKSHLFQQKKWNLSGEKLLPQKSRNNNMTNFDTSVVQSIPQEKASLSNKLKFSETSVKRGELYNKFSSKNYDKFFSKDLNYMRNFQLPSGKLDAAAQNKFFNELHNTKPPVRQLQYAIDESIAYATPYSSPERYKPQIFFTAPFVDGAIPVSDLRHNYFEKPKAAEFLNTLIPYSVYDILLYDFYRQQQMKQLQDNSLLPSHYLSNMLNQEPAYTMRENFLEPFSQGEISPKKYQHYYNVPSKFFPESNVDFNSEIPFDYRVAPNILNSIQPMGRNNAFFPKSELLSNGVPPIDRLANYESLPTEEMLNPLLQEAKGKFNDASYGKILSQSIRQPSMIPISSSQQNYNFWDPTISVSDYLNIKNKIPVATFSAPSENFFDDYVFQRQNQIPRQTMSLGNLINTSRTSLIHPILKIPGTYQNFFASASDNNQVLGPVPTDIVTNFFGANDISGVSNTPLNFPLVFPLIRSSLAPPLNRIQSSPVYTLLHNLAHGSNAPRPSLKESDQQEQNFKNVNDRFNDNMFYVSSTQQGEKKYFGQNATISDMSSNMVAQNFGTNGTPFPQFDMQHIFSSIVKPIRNTIQNNRHSFLESAKEEKNNKENITKALSEKTPKTFVHGDAVVMNNFVHVLPKHTDSNFEHSDPLEGAMKLLNDISDKDNRFL